MLPPGRAPPSPAPPSPLRQRRSFSCEPFFAPAPSLSSLANSPANSRQLDGRFLPALFYNAGEKTWDVIIIGGGIIGLSLAIALRKRGAAVLIVERGQPGREASHAAGGMLVDCPLETPAALQPLATASARLYPEFAHELELESGMKVDLRDHGSIIFPSPEHGDRDPEFVAQHPLPSPLQELEPALADPQLPVLYLKEGSVDPRGLSAAAWKTAKHRGVDFSSGDEVTAVAITDRRATGVTTIKTSLIAPKVVNCAGAWSGQIKVGQMQMKSGPIKPLPTRPVKGQMLCLIMPKRELIRHVIRTPQAYLIPRSDGRLLVGATVEEAGFDKRTDLATIQRLHHAALALVPELRSAKILEDWAGLRPGTPDALPSSAPPQSPVTTSPLATSATVSF